MCTGTSRCAATAGECGVGTVFEVMSCSIGMPSVSNGVGVISEP